MIKEGELGSSEPPNDPSAYKVLIVGDIGTGKTSLVKRLVSDTFLPHYKSTIGVDFGIKKMDVDGKPVTLHLWDIAGQERYGNMTRIYYQGSRAALVVFDVTRTSTFEGAKKWKSDIDTKVRYMETDLNIPVILLANKIDLLSKERDEDDGWGVAPADMDQYCKNNGFVGWFETSAKDNLNIQEAVTALVKAVIPLDTKENEPRPRETVKVNTTTKAVEKKEETCC